MCETTESGRGIAAQITGCNFMIAPMTDRYEDVIMGAVSQVDTGRVFSETQKLGTVYRGYGRDVLDTLQACFCYAYRPDVHMTMSVTLAKGCPCDTAADYVFAEEGEPANQAGCAGIHFPVDCKFALYPMGKADYIDDIMAVVELAQEMGVYAGGMHYATTLRGDVHELFAYFARAVAYCEEHVPHFVFEITMSVNSPTAE